jgi:hypothetical protein
LFGPKTASGWGVATSLVGPAGATGSVGPQGPQGSFPNGSAAGNTPYWDGTQWIVNNSNIHNNGSSIGIGTNNPNTSSKVEISSTDQGFLMPRMSEAQRNAILSPATGLLIFQTDNTPGFYYYTGTTWIGLSNASSSSGGSDAKTLIYTTQGF